MTNIRDLFINKSSLVNKSLSDFTEKISSSDLVALKQKFESRIKPEIDYYDPSTFVKYGLAEEYYSNSIKQIYLNYPYDGSERDILEWKISSSYLDEFILDNIYPRETGYISFKDDNGELLSFDYYGSSRDLLCYETPNFITVDGGANLGNIYNSSSYQENNLLIRWREGLTVEFWMKRNSWDPNTGSYPYEIFPGFPGILPVYPTEYIASFSSFESEETKLFIDVYQTSYSSENKQKIVFSIRGYFFTEQHIIDLDDDFVNLDWNHFAFSWCYSLSEDNSVIDIYHNGELKYTTKTTPGLADLVVNTKTKLTGTIGCVSHYNYAAPHTGSGHGQLFDTQIDEFRFWRTKRTSKEIKENWFTHVYGGNNTETTNIDLGIYYKFNDSITQTSSIDYIVLDYSGRNSNGIWTNYTSDNRSTGSAFIDYGLTEIGDPIIYPTHRRVSNVLTTYSDKGREWDYQNNNSIINMIPSAIVEDSEINGDSELKKLTQIISSYFDTIASQIEYLPKVFSTDYLVSGSINSELLISLLKSRGMNVDNIFEDYDVKEFISDRNTDTIYENSISDVKNFIYRNIYNNLNYLYKSKGTNNSFRNLFRCFGIDDENLKLNIYADREQFEISSEKRYLTTKRKNYLDLGGRQDAQSMKALVYQDWDGINSASFGYILDTSSDEFGTGSALTAETTVIFPKQYPQYDINDIFYPEESLTGSIFGFFTPAETTHINDTTLDNNELSAQLYFVKKDRYSGYAKFSLVVTGTVIAETSKYYPVFENSKWTFGMKIGPTGSLYGTELRYGSYSNIISLYGVREESNNIIEEFELSSITSETIYNAKKFYVGSYRTNMTGTLIYPTECLFSYFRVYLDDLNYDIIKDHSKDPFNYGNEFAYKNIYNLDIKANDEWNYSAKSLILSWDFENTSLTASNGTATIYDFVSGSATGSITSNTWFNELSTKNYIGTAYGFNTTASIIDRGYVSVSQNRIPENINGLDTVNLLDDKNFNVDNHPINYFYSIENSPYNIISEEILHLFSSVKEFNNLIGEPVHKFRYSYKGLDKLKQIFFDKIQNTKIDIDRYFEYYKWIDNAISNVVVDFFPASANSSKKIINLIENHVLERNKYKFPYPLTKQTFVNKQGTIPKSSNANIQKFNKRALGDYSDEGNLLKEKFISYNIRSSVVQQIPNIIENNYNPVYKLISDRTRLKTGLSLPRTTRTPTWLTGYLDCDGVVDAIATNAMVGIDQANSIWTVVGIVELSSGAATYWTSTRTSGGTTRIFSYVKSGASWVFQARINGFNGGEITITAPSLAVVGEGVNRTVSSEAMYGFITSNSEFNSSNTSISAETAYSADMILASVNGIVPLVGKLWGLFIVSEIPTETQLRQCLTAPPWQVWSPSKILRAWNPADSFSSGGNVYIPDISEEYGGPNSPINALMRNGDISRIIIP